MNLVPGRADTPEMVEARDAFLRAGHFRPLSVALAEEARAAAAAGGVAPPAAAPVVDIGAGTGHHLAAVLDALPIGAASASTPRLPPCAARREPPTRRRGWRGRVEAPAPA